MTHERRQRVALIVAITTTMVLHLAIIVGIALAGEWRVWRFITNAIVQLDVLLMLGWLYWSSFSAIRARSAAFEEVGR